MSSFLKDLERFSYINFNKINSLEINLNKVFSFNFYPRPSGYICHSVGPSVTKNWNSKFSALVLDRDLRFSRGHQTKPNQSIPNHTRPYQTIPNQTKGISALGLDRDLGFSREHQTIPYHTFLKVCDKFLKVSHKFLKVSDKFLKVSDKFLQCNYIIT